MELLEQSFPLEHLVPEWKFTIFNVNIGNYLATFILGETFHTFQRSSVKKLSKQGFFSDKVGNFI